MKVSDETILLDKIFVMAVTLYVFIVLMSLFNKFFFNSLYRLVKMPFCIIKTGFLPTT